MPEEIKKNLSQEEKRFANMAKRFIRQASIATKNFRMFGERHPILLNSLRNIHEILKTSLVGRETITYTFLEGAFLVEDIPLKDMDPKVYSLITDLKECGVTSLTFQNGVTEDELNVLLKTLSSGPTFIKDEGGVINILRKRNVSRIKVDEIYFKRVSKKEEEAIEAKTQLADMLVVDFLLGKKAMPNDKLGALAREVSVNPKKMSSILSEVSRQGGGAGGFGTAGFACSGIDKLASGIKAAGGKSDESINKDISNVILSLEPSLRNEVLRSDAELCKNSAYIKGAIAEFSDEVIINIIISDLLESRASVAEARKLIRRIIPDESRRTKIFPALEKRLIQKGVSQDTCSRLLEGKFWADMTNDEKVKSIEGHEPVYCAEIGLVDEIENLIFELLSEKKFDSVRAVIKKLVGNLSSEDADFKVRFVRDFERIAFMVFQCDAYLYKKEIIESLAGGQKSAREKELKSRFKNIFVSLINLSMQKKSFGDLTGLVNAAGYGSVKGDVFKDRVLEALFREIISDERTEKRDVGELAQAIGKDAEGALCDILISIEEDDFESYRKRHEIAAILEGLGKDIEGLLIGKLSSEKAETVKNSLEALSEIGTEKSIPAIQDLLKHKNSKIQKRAQVALKNIEKRISRS